MNSINVQNYIEQCKKHISPRADTPMKKELMFALGTADEAGEVAGVIKKIHFHEMDEEEGRVRLLSEAGDVFWYLLQLLDMYGIDFYECLEHNLEKLNKRHGEEFRPGYTSDTVQPPKRKLVLLMGFSDDVDAYIADRLKNKKHDREIFLALAFNYLEILRGFNNGYETVITDITRGDSVSNAFTELQARQHFEHLGVSIEVVRLENSSANQVK